MKLRTVSRVLIATVIAVAVMIAAWKSFSPKSTAGAPALIGMTPDSNPAPGFTLRDQNGRLVSLRQERGHEVILSFFYSHCPDTCPLTAQKLRTVIGHLGRREAQRIRVIIVSTDPYGDYPASMREFLRRNGGPGWKFLIGTPHQLERVWKSYGEFVDARPGVMHPMHLAFTYFIGANGNEQALMPDATPEPAITHDLHYFLHDKDWLNSLPVDPQVGARAPSFDLAAENTGGLRLSQFQGKPLVINFWATYCGPCTTEMPLLARTYKQFHGKLQMIGIDEQEPSFEVRPFVRKVKATYPIALDSDGNAFYAYGAGGTPTTFFINSHGVIRAIRVGQMNSAELYSGLQDIVKIDCSPVLDGCAHGPYRA